MHPNPSGSSGSSRLHFSIVIAACIVAAGLVSAARIIAGRPVVLGGMLLWFVGGVIRRKIEKKARKA